MKISKKEREKIRQRIIEAAVEIIIEKDFKSATMREISRKAQIADATIYKYFPTKEAILYGYYTEKMNELTEALKVVEDFSSFSLKEQVQTTIETALNQFLGDREFVDNVVSSILVFEDSGVIQNYAGGFSDWQRHGKHLAEMDNPVSTKNKQSKENNKQKNNNKKLSYKLKLELDALPEKIEQLEQEINELEEQTQAEDFYSKPYQAQQPILEELQNKHGDLHDAIRRWDELESMEKELQTN